METKEDLILSITERLNSVFVSDYDLVKGALADVNNYLKVMDIDYEYTYDVFCKDFLSMTKSFIDKMTIDELNKMDTFTFVQEIVAIMIYYKINDVIDNEDVRKYKLLQHVLIKKNI